jgi:hypothetical protein
MFMYLRQEIVYPVQHKLVVFYTGDEACLLRGTSWMFKYNSSSRQYLKC